MIGSILRHFQQRHKKALLYVTSLVAHSRDAILGLTAEGKILLWNRGAEELYGFTAQEMAGQSVRRLFSELSLGKFEPAFAGCLIGESAAGLELEHLHKNGKPLRVLLTLSPILDKNGTVIGVSMIARNAGEVAFAAHTTGARREQVMQSLLEDLHASKKSLETQKKSLQEANERLEVLSKIKDDFVATASHEPRTPLTAIREGVSLIHDRVLGPINEEQYEFLGAVDENIDRLTELIDNILDLAKIESGRFSVARRRVSLPELIRSMHLNCKAKASHQIRISLPQVSDVYADPARITQVLWNLFSNAVKFTPDQGCITFSLREQGGRVTVSIEDTGVGIAKEDLPNLFQKFSQVGSRQCKGTGLGLALCKEIVELHKGEISVESVKSVGSKFTFTLPVYESAFVLEEQFNAQIEAARRGGCARVALLVLDAHAAQQKIPNGNNAHAPGIPLEETADFVRNNVFGSDSVLAIEPHWIVVLTVGDLQAVTGLGQRVVQCLRENGAAGLPAELLFKGVVYPEDGRDGKQLFSKATELLGQSGHAERKAEWTKK